MLPKTTTRVLDVAASGGCGGGDADCAVMMDVWLRSRAANARRRQTEYNQSVSLLQYQQCYKGGSRVCSRLKTAGAQVYIPCCGPAIRWPTTHVWSSATRFVQSHLRQNLSNGKKRHNYLLHFLRNNFSPCCTFRTTMSPTSGLLFVAHFLSFKINWF